LTHYIFLFIFSIFISYLYYFILFSLRCLFFTLEIFLILAFSSHFWLYFSHFPPIPFLINLFEHTPHADLYFSEFSLFIFLRWHYFLLSTLYFHIYFCCFLSFIIHFILFSISFWEHIAPSLISFITLYYFPFIIHFIFSFSFIFYIISLYLYIFIHFIASESHFSGWVSHFSHWCHFYLFVIAFIFITWHIFCQRCCAIIFLSCFIISFIIFSDISHIFIYRDIDSLFSLFYIFLHIFLSHLFT